MTRKVLIIYNGYIKKGGGVVLYIQHLEKALLKNGIKVDVWSRDNIGLIFKYFCAILQRFGDYVFPGLGYILYIYLTKLYLYFSITRNEYDFFIFNDLLTGFDLQNSIIIIHALRSDKEQNYHLSGIRKKLFTILLNLYEKRTLNKINKAYLFTVSEEFREEIYSKLNCYDKRIQILYPPFDLINYNITNFVEKNKSNRICYVGMLHSRKNPFFAIELLKKLNKEYNKDYRLEIIGDGMLKNDLIALTQKYGLNKYITFHGYLENQKVNRIMNDSKILILPSFSESFGLVMLEAKMNGMVTISNKDLTIPSWLIDYPLELDIEIWAKKIIEIMEYENINSVNKMDNIKKILEKNLINFLDILQGKGNEKI